MALPMGALLNGRYMTGKVLGVGGFGITYLGYDLTLEIKVAVKEYMPSGLATRHSDKYSVALTGVQVEGLPPNCLIAAGEYPVVSCGQLAAQVGETMRLLHLLSADTDNLGAVCSSLAEAMLNLTDALLCSRVQQRENDGS